MTVVDCIAVLCLIHWQPGQQQQWLTQQRLVIKCLQIPTTNVYYMR